MDVEGTEIPNLSRLCRVVGRAVARRHACGVLRSTRMRDTIRTWVGGAIAKKKLVFWLV